MTISPRAIGNGDGTEPAPESAVAAAGRCVTGEEEGVLAAAPPLRGRLVVFPHGCPHAGHPAVSCGFLRCVCRTACPPLANIRSSQYRVDTGSVSSLSRVLY